MGPFVAPFFHSRDLLYPLQVVFRMRIDHRDRRLLREDLGLRLAGTLVILEESLGWAWLSDRSGRV